MTATAALAQVDQEWRPERITCGTYHPNLETHRRCMILAGYAPEDASSYDDTGCGQSMHWTYAYRCVDCGRWFHQACIRRHFQKAADPPY